MENSIITIVLAFTQFMSAPNTGPREAAAPANVNEPTTVAPLPPPRDTSAPNFTEPGARAPTVTVAYSPTLGYLLADSKGITVYKSTQDPLNTSTCMDACSITWPPFLLTPGSRLSLGSGIVGTLGTIQRPDGSQQITYNNMPLYYYYQDSKPGDAFGDQAEARYYVIKLGALIR